jgi:hypothetical protein
MRRKLLPAIALVFALVLIAKFWPGESTRTDTSLGGDFAILSNRIWIDHMPTNERDKVDVFLLFDDPTFGGFSRSSAYEGDWTSFEWSLHKGLVLSMLQSQSKHKVHPKITGGASCLPFDYCLKLKGAPRGSKTYVSMKDWVVNGAQDFDVREALAGFVATYD